MDEATKETLVRPRLRRHIGMLLAMLVLAAPLAVVGTLGTESPAAAACGKVGTTWTHKDGVAKVRMVATRYCEGAVHIDLTLYDTKCDSRSVAAQFRKTNNVVLNTHYNTKGCNTSISYSGGRQYPSSFKLCLYAYNSFGSSSTHCRNYTV